jgi:hypothetical protein
MVLKHGTGLPRIIRPFTVALPAAHPQPAAAAEGRQRLAATAGVGGQAFTGHLWPSGGLSSHGTM